MPHLDDVAHWALASAPFVEALEPEDLRRRVRELAHGAAELHEREAAQERPF